MTSSAKPPTSPVTLKELRSQLHIAQVELAKKTELWQSVISRLENAESLVSPSLSRYVEGLGGELELSVLIDGKRYVLRADKQTMEPKRSIKSMNRLGFLEDSLDALKKRFPNGRARKGPGSGRAVQANIAKPALILTVEAPKHNDELGVQLIVNDVGSRKALGKLFRTVSDKELPQDVFLEGSDGRDPEPGEKRTLGLWWTLSGSYASQRAVRDACVEWWIEALEKMEPRGRFKLMAS